MATPFPFKQITLQQFVQPYADKFIGLGSLDGMQQFLSPVATTVDLADATAGINTVDKYIGKPAYDETTGLPVWASGPLPADTWDGATAGGGGDVTKVGTPVNNEIGVWTGDGTLEGDTNFQWDGTSFILSGNILNTDSNTSLLISGADTAITGINLLLGGTTGASNYDFVLSKDTDLLAFFNGGSGFWRFRSGTGVPVDALDIGAGQIVTVMQGHLDVGNAGGASPLIDINGQSTADPKLAFQQNGVDRAFLQYLDTGDIFDIDADGEIQISSSNTLAVTIDNSQAVNIVGGLTIGQRLDLPASTTGRASLRIPHGTAPTSPTNGDMWTTTAGLFVRINGVTVGPLT